MYIRNRTIGQSFIKAWQNNKIDEKALSKNFLLFCQKKNWLSRLPKIIDEIEKIAETLSQKEKIIIRSVIKLTKSQEQSILFKYFPKNQGQVENELKPELIAGFCAEGQGRMVDASLIYQLNRFKKEKSL